MLYIDCSDGHDWLALVEVLSERGTYDMALFLYPDSEYDEFPEPFSPSDEDECLERVTEYPDGDEPPVSSRLRVSHDLIDSLAECADEFEDWGDSLALYPPAERTWEAAFVPHERMILVREVRLQEFLDAAGITATEEAPEGW